MNHEKIMTRTVLIETLESRMLLSGTPTSVPYGPYGLHQVYAASTEIDLAWQDNNSGPPADGYTLTISGQPSVTLPATAVSDKATGLTPSTNFTFTVTAFNSIGDSSTAGPVTYNTLLVNPPPSPTSVPYGPYALTATPVSSTEIDLHWSDNNDGPAASGYAVYVNGLGPVDAGPTVGLGPNATSFKVTNLSPGTIHSFAVEAYNAIGASSRTGPVSAATLGASTNPGGPPNAPYALHVIAATPISDVLSFVDNADNETGFVIERALISNGIYSAIATLPPAVGTRSLVQYTDSAFVAFSGDSPAGYEYDVYAVNGRYVSSTTGPAIVPFATFATQADSRVLVGGQVSGTFPEPVTITRYNADLKTIDMTYGTAGVTTIAPGPQDAVSTVVALAVLPNGNAVAQINGGSSSNNPYQDTRLVLLGSTGTVLNTVTLGAGTTTMALDVFAFLLAIGPTGKIIVAGNYYDPAIKSNNTPEPIVIDVFNSDLTPDTSFGTGGRVQTNSGLPASGNINLTALTANADGSITIDYLDSSNTIHVLNLTSSGAVV